MHGSSEKWWKNSSREWHWVGRSQLQVKHGRVVIYSISSLDDQWSAQTYTTNWSRTCWINCGTHLLHPPCVHQTSFVSWILPGLPHFLPLFHFCILVELWIRSRKHESAATCAVAISHSVVLFGDSWHCFKVTSVAVLCWLAANFTTSSTVPSAVLEVQG